jgi:hypothetical protein
MLARACTRRLASLLAAVALPATAAAQAPDPAPSSGARASLGGELSFTLGPRDDDAFFNYTDYERNALRTARVRLFGEWRVVPSLSLIGEVRTEDTDVIAASAAYVRWRPWNDRDLVIQAGRIPPVAGAFARRGYGRDNSVMGLPLGYQYLTSLRADALPTTIDQLLRMRGRGWRPSYPLGSQAVETGVPLFSSSNWDTGVEASWRNDWFSLAGEWSLGSPAVPVVRETNDGRQWSGRLAVHLPEGLTLGVSGARGQWIESRVLDLLPTNLRGASTQTMVGTDLEFGQRRWLIRAEWLRTVFQLPLLAEPTPDTSVSSWSGFVEARYRLHPRWQIAARFDALSFSRLTGTSGVATSWDAPVERVEAVLGFRATRHIELRGGWQHNWREGGRVLERGYPAAQLLYWF